MHSRVRVHRVMGRCGLGIQRGWRGLCLPAPVSDPFDWAIPLPMTLIVSCLTFEKSGGAHMCARLSPGESSMT